MGQIIIEQTGDDCIVTIKGETRVVPHCNAIKLANAIWDKSGEKYTPEEMADKGFEPRHRI